MKLLCSAAYLSILFAGSSHAEVVSLSNPDGHIVAVVNTDQLQYAVATNGALTLKFIGGDENRLTVNSTGEGSKELVQQWLAQIVRVTQ